MKNGDNSLLVASFNNVKGEVIRTMSVSKAVNFNIGMIPEEATSYYLYSKKDDGKYSNDSICQIGRPLEEVVKQNMHNKILLSILIHARKSCAYLVSDGKEYVVPMNDNTKLVSNFNDFVNLFKSDLENVKTNGKQLTKKM